MVDPVKKPTDKSVRVEMTFLEAVRRRCPGSRLVLEALGDMYTRSGRYAEGLEVDLELIKMCPCESIIWYNLGCSYALVGRKEDAFDALFKAVDLGYCDGDWMRKDSDLASLKDDPRFPVLVHRVKADGKQTSLS